MKGKSGTLRWSGEWFVLISMMKIAVRRYLKGGENSDLYALMISGDRTKEARNVEELHERLTYGAAVRIGGMCVLVVLFSVLAFAICCHSFYVIALLYEDYEWRRDNMEHRIFRNLPQNEPLHSPIANDLHTAMSQSKTSIISMKIDKTQDSCTEKSLSLASLN